MSRNPMSFRDVLVVLRTYPEGVSISAAVAAVETAAALAPRVSAIACAIKPRAPRSILGDALINISAMVGAEHRKSEEDAQRLLAAFEKAAKGKGVLGQQVLESYYSFEVPDVLANHARLRDLTILPSPQGSDVPDFDARWYAEAVIFESGHPAIVLPAQSRGPSRSKR
jgi:hypothetical protein